MSENKSYEPPPIQAGYVVVEASTPKEAIEKSPFFVGQRAVVQEVQAIANSNGTWSLFAKFKLEERKP